MKQEVVVQSPPWSSSADTGEESTLQQIAPYIGRIKPAIARHLITEFTEQADIVFDPFCGSGVIPFEAAALGRTVIASDINAYGVLLTKAKLTPPESAEAAIKRFRAIWAVAEARRERQDLRSVPPWVRAFFHPETLRAALALRDELVRRREHFLLACLLGILHHQRPGFLSYPSSHLVPYLRDRILPRSTHPELYEERDVPTRMERKIHRAFRRTPENLAKAKVSRSDCRTASVPARIGVLITSPPYMNELDYVRDNRLRLWFLHRALPKAVDTPKRDREGQFRKLVDRTLRRFAPRVSRAIVLIVGDTRRGKRPTDVARLVKEIFSSRPALSAFQLTQVIEDRIPDVRRSRRKLRGTKRETVLVFARTKRQTAR